MGFALINTFVHVNNSPADIDSGLARRQACHDRLIRLLSSRTNPVCPPSLDKINSRIGDHVKKHEEAENAKIELAKLMKEMQESGQRNEEAMRKMQSEYESRIQEMKQHEEQVAKEFRNIAGSTGSQCVGPFGALGVALDGLVGFLGAGGCLMM